MQVTVVICGVFYFVLRLVVVSNERIAQQKCNEQEKRESSRQDK